MYSGACVTDAGQCTLTAHSTAPCRSVTCASAMVIPMPSVRKNRRDTGKKTRNGCMMITFGLKINININNNFCEVP